MLDLKAKLAAAGLVSAADVAAAERKSSRGPTSPKGQDRKASSQAGPQGPRSEHQGRAGHQPDRRSDRPSGPRPQGQPRGDANNADRSGANNRHNQANKPARPAGLDVVALKRGGKGEAYDAIRRAVERARLDPLRAIPGEHASAFHFTTATGQLSRLMLEPEAHTGLADGSAGIIAFMSHHGLAHCVVPRPLAEAVHEVFPLWLRVLHGHPGAGQQEAPRPPPTVNDASREPRAEHASEASTATAVRAAGPDEVAAAADDVVADAAAAAATDEVVADDVVADDVVAGELSVASEPAADLAGADEPAAVRESDEPRGA